MRCSHCSKEIPPARLEILPETTTCVECSEVKPYRGIIQGSHEHKGYSLEIVPADDPIIEYYEDQIERHKSRKANKPSED